MHEEEKQTVITTTISNKELEDARIKLAQQDFAREAKRLRLKAKLSQEDLAAKMGIEQGIISRIERSIYGITLDVVLNYARVFNDDPHRLADIYWGNTSSEISDENRMALEKIMEILETYYLPKRSKNLEISHPPQPYRLVQMTPELEKQIAADEQKAIAEAQALQEEQGQQKQEPAKVRRTRQHINKTSPGS